MSTPRAASSARVAFKDASDAGLVRVRVRA
jgi:hypothetical protein